MKISCATSGFTMYKDFGRDVRDHLISSILIHNNLLKQQVFKRRNGLRGRRKMRWKNGALSPLLTLLHIIHGVREAHMFRNREQFIVQINHESELLLIALTERPREEEYTHTHSYNSQRERNKIYQPEQHHCVLLFAAGLMNFFRSGALKSSTHSLTASRLKSPHLLLLLYYGHAKINTRHVNLRMYVLFMPPTSDTKWIVV